MSADLYDVLGVPRDATEDQIKEAYRRAVREAHPDREGGSHELMVLVNQANDTLRDRLRREEYDRSGRTGETKPLQDRGRDAMIGVFAAAVLTDEPDPLAASKMKLLEARQEVATTLQGAEQRRRAVEDRRKRLKRGRKLKKGERNEPTVLDGVIADVLKSIDIDLESMRDRLAVIDSALEQLGDYRYDPETGASWSAYDMAAGFVTVKGTSASERNEAARKFWGGR